MASIAGHKTECMCASCLWADMNEFTGHVEVATKVEPERTRYATPGTSAGNGTVRYASVPQVRYIRRLLAERDTTNMVWLPGSEAIRRDINRLPDAQVKVSLKGASNIIDRLLACPELPAEAIVVRSASTAQINYVKLLCERKGMTDLSANVNASNVSATIDMLKALNDKPAPAASQAGPALSEGLYRRTDGGIVYAKESKAGRLYGKLYNPTTKSFEYVSGALSGPLTRLTFDEAKDLSVEMGQCARCGRTLTATVDGVAPRDRFIGPICAGKLGY